MTDKSETHVYSAPERQSGYDPSDEPQIKDDISAPPLAEEPAAEENRGRPAAITRAGEVIGSGASAGGKGGREDFDADPQAGGGTFMVRHNEPRPDKGGDAPQHNSA